MARTSRASTARLQAMIGDLTAVASHGKRIRRERLTAWDPASSIAAFRISGADQGANGAGGRRLLDGGMYARWAAVLGDYASARVSLARALVGTGKYVGDHVHVAGGCA